VRVARDHHVKTVGAKVDRRYDVGHGAGSAASGRSNCQALKEEPHPQVV
jgi:hypothetical protein